MKPAEVKGCLDRRNDELKFYQRLKIFLLISSKSSSDVEFLCFVQLIGIIVWFLSLKTLMLGLDCLILFAHQIDDISSKA